MTRADSPSRPSFRRVVLAAIALAGIALAPTALAAPMGSVPPERVTVIGDSVATAVQYNPDARALLGRGIDLDLELAVCRRLVGDSCPYQGIRPPTLVDLLPALQLGGTVVVALGYNDYEATFPASVETALQALERAGIEHILWLTLRAERPSYLQMNDVIRAAAERHPGLNVVDWNLYSRSHPDWFQPEGIHLTDLGAVALATLIHGELEVLGLVQAPVARSFTIEAQPLQPAWLERLYRVRLTASGGVNPVRWEIARGRLPVGVRLTRNGWLTGMPSVAGRSRLTFRAVDARGRSASLRLVLIVYTP